MVRDIARADLVIDRVGTLDQTSDVDAFLATVTGRSDKDGVFVLGTNSAGHAVLFYSDGPGGWTQGVAEFTSINDPAQIQLSDFMFV